MKKLIISTLLLILLFTNAYGSSDPRRVSHLLPSPFTLEGGVFVYGTHLGYGITDHLEIGTNLAALLAEILNANAKVSIWNNDIIATGIAFKWSQYDLESVSGKTLATITSYGAGPIISLRLSENFAWSNGVTFEKREISGIESGSEKSGLIQGNLIQSEFSWIYSDTPRAIALGGSYDTTYSLYGVGISHHWTNFKLGFHYYPQADKDNILPIIAGGGSIQF